MTDDDKALVKWLRDEAALAYDREDTNTLNETADRIEAQAAEIEKLREEVAQVVTGRFIAAENAIEAAAAEERAKIVAWLRSKDTYDFDDLAIDIEAKEHLK